MCDRACFFKVIMRREKFDICSLCSHSIIKRSESVLAQASECRLLLGGSFCKRAECEAPRRMPCAETEYIFLFTSICCFATRYISRSARNSIYAHFVRIRYVAFGNDGRYATCDARHCRARGRENERKKSNLPLFCRLLSFFEDAFTTHTLI